MPHVFIKAWTSKQPLRVEGTSNSTVAFSVAAWAWASWAPAKTSMSASRVEALSAASSGSDSPERARLQRPQFELMQDVQIGLLKPVVQEPRHELTPQVKTLPRQEAHEEDTPWPMRQLETHVALPAPGTPKQRPPQL